MPTRKGSNAAVIKKEVMDIVFQLKRPENFYRVRMIIRYTKMGSKDIHNIAATLTSADGSVQWTWEAGDLDFQRAMDFLNTACLWRKLAKN
jgi:hypothetical protein